MKLKNLLGKLLCVLSGLFLASTVQAANYTWSTASGSWNTSSWLGTPPVNATTGPVDGDNIYGLATNPVLTLAGDRQVDDLTNLNAAGTWTLQVTSGSNSLTLDNIFNNSSGNLAFRAALVTGTMSLNVGNITQGGSGLINIGNVGAANRLDALNVSGTTTVSAGAVNINVDNGLAVNPDTYSIGMLNVSGAGVLRLNQVSYAKTGTTVANSTGLIGSGGQIMNGSNAGGVGTFTSLIVNTTGTYQSGSLLTNGSVGTLAVTKSGAGTQTLTADNTYTGGTTITDGRLQLGGGGTTGSLVGNVAMTGTTASLAFNRSNAYTFGGTISGNGKVVQAGSGTTTLSASNSYTGGTEIEAGALQIANDQNLGDAAGGVAISNGAALSFATGTNNYNRATVLGAGGGAMNLVSNTIVNWQGAISGVGGLTKGGSASTGAVLYLTGSNTYQGGTRILGGVLRVDNDQNLGDATGNIVFDNGANTARLENQQDMTSARDIILNGTTATLSASGTSTMELNGVISGGGGINKTFSGTLMLGGNNTYSGGTTITTGSLLVTNTEGSATGTGAVTVAAARILGGNGFIAPDAGNNVTVSGILSPGVNNEGVLTFGMSGASKLDFAAGSSIEMTLGTSSDLIAFLAAGDWLSGSGNTLLSLTLGAGFSYDNSYVIFQDVTTIGFSFAGVTGYDAGSYTHNFSQVGDDYVLSFTAVPEPSAVLLLGCAGLAGLVSWRVRKNRTKSAL